MSYERAKKQLRRYAMCEYNTYRSLCSPYPSKERGEAWHRHEIAADIFRDVRKSKSKSHKAALAICKDHVKFYKNKCKNYYDTALKCLEICERVVGDT